MATSSLSQHINSGGFGNDSQSNPTHLNDNLTQIFEFAEILDVTLDTKYRTELGKIKFRFLNTSGQHEDSLPYAYPLFSSIKVFPVKHEVVMIAELFNKYYYMYPIAKDNNINQNSFPYMTHEVPIESNPSGKYESSQSSGIPDKKSKSGDVELGEYFEDKKLVVPALLPDEGDVIIQGRFGNNIRFGSNSVDKTNLPQLKISLMDDDKLVVKKESLDKDNSIWLSNDGKIPFEIKSIPIHKDNTPPTDYDGKQIFIFSDRLVFQSKMNEMIFYSMKGIHFTSNTNFSIDTDKKIVTHSKMETEINSLKTYIGKVDTENLVIGQKWKEMMLKLLDIMLKFNDKDMTHTHPTGTGPSGPPIDPSPYSTFKSDTTSVKTSVSNEEQLSDDNFTTKKNK